MRILGVNFRFTSSLLGVYFWGSLYELNSKADQSFVVTILLPIISVPCLFLIHMQGVYYGSDRGLLSVSNLGLLWIFSIATLGRSEPGVNRVNLGFSLNPSSARLNLIGYVQQYKLLYGSYNLLYSRTFTFIRYFNKRKLSN